MQAGVVSGGEVTSAEPNAVIEGLPGGVALTGAYGSLTHL